MDTGIGSAISLFSSLANGLISSNAEKAYQKDLENYKNKYDVAEATRRADKLLSESTMGLPGYETLSSEIDTQMPTTLNQLRDSLSGGGMISVLSDIYTKANAAKRALSVQNAQAIQAQKNKYADFLGGVMGPQEQDVQAQKLALSLAQSQSKMNQSKDQLSFANQGLGSLTGLLSGDYSDLIAILSGDGKKPKGGEYMDAPAMPQQEDYTSPNNLFSFLGGLTG